MLYRSSGGDLIFGIIGALVVFAICFIFALISESKDKKRKISIGKYCKRAKIRYRESSDSIPGCDYEFKITSYGYSQAFYSIMSGKRLGIEYKVMDFYYDVGGKNGTRQATICLLSKNGLKLPDFYMREENVFFDGIGQMLGGQDIDFDDDLDFSNTYVLQGSNEKAIRRFFTPNIRNTFTRASSYGYVYESGDNYFLVCDNSGYKDLWGRLDFLMRSVRIFATILFESELNKR